MNKFENLIKNRILFDSHCHLNDKSYDEDRDLVVKNALDFGVEKIIDIAVCIESGRKVLETAKLNSNVLACIGVDPEIFILGSDLEEKDFSFNDLKILEKLIEENLAYISMIGETGIDNYWNRKNNLETDLIIKSFENQKELFTWHIEIANKFKLPLSIHSREAIVDCLKILSQNLQDRDRILGVFHSLTPDSTDDEDSFYDKVKNIHELGFLVGLNGIITYKSATILRNTVLKIIKEKNRTEKYSLEDIYNAGFVIETDGPFLAPDPFRGERNVPANVKRVLEFLIEQLTISARG